MIFVTEFYDVLIHQVKSHLFLTMVFSLPKITPGLYFRFFSVLSAYLLVGVGFNKFGRKESGANLIPNITFWASLPGLVKVIHV